jgi:hypothetical protein
MLVSPAVQLVAAIVGIVGGCSGLISTAWNLRDRRRTEIDTLRNGLGQAWTNEGDIASTEILYMTLELALSDGDLTGSLQTPEGDRPFDANVDVYWGHGIVTISRLYERTPKLVMIAKVQLKGNRNRLHWKALDDRSQGALPTETVLWPVPSGIPRPVISLNRKVQG